MIWDVVVQIGEVAPAVEAPNAVRFILDSTTSHRRIFHGRNPDSTWRLLERLELPMAPDAAVDLLRLASVVYACDCRLPRKAAADAWARHIRLHLPVLETDKWVAARSTVEDLLRFLTGDVWECAFHDGAPSPPPRSGLLRDTKRPLEATAVCLLSGGLDSFIGAADAMAAGEQLYLVSHTQGKYTSPPQEAIVQALGEKFGRAGFRHVQVGVRPPPEKHYASVAAPISSESTTRSRSLVFLAYGTLVAASLDGEQPLLVPENGFISINPPLVPSRVGSHSTRTTHPQTIKLLEQILKHLGLPVQLRLDYRFKTKGEMLNQARDAGWVKEMASLTESCGKPNFAATASKSSSLTQCGACAPCIIRRAALRAAGLPDEKYLHQSLNPQTMPNVRAFAIALERLKVRPGKLLTDVVGTGPIEPDDLERVLGVVERGLSEVAEILP